MVYVLLLKCVLWIIFVLLAFYLAVCSVKLNSFSYMKLKSRDDRERFPFPPDCPVIV